MRLLTSLGIAALAVGLGAAAQAETVKVGIMLPFSGVNADLGDAQKKAFDLYLKLHAKDIAPHKVEVVERDEGPPSGANAKTVATELITRDKAQIIVGVVFSPSAIAMAPVMSQAKVPLLISNAGTAWITTLSPTCTFATSQPQVTWAMAQLTPTTISSGSSSGTLNTTWLGYR